MLVLSRKVGEQVVLPGLNVTIQILRIHRSRVVIGFAAAANVAIRREELPPLSSTGTKATTVGVPAAGEGLERLAGRGGACGSDLPDR
jgi:carbon storage regulator CsrA